MHKVAGITCDFRFSVVFQVINYCLEHGVRISDFEKFKDVYVENRAWIIIFEAIQFVEVSTLE